MRRGGDAKLRRTWPQRFLILVNASAVIAAAVTAGALAYSNDQVAQIRRNVFSPGVLATDELEPGDPQNYLLIGVDDSTGVDGSAGESRTPGTKLTDTIMILRVDPATTQASILSFPRDLLVDIPDRTSRSRINAAFEFGGGELLVRTIRENFDIPVHHVIEIDFAGFQSVVEIVDGIPVYFPHPVRSEGGSDDGGPTVELDIPEPGCWILGPRQALGFARVRKDYQVQDAGGRWHTDMGGDYSRVQRQQLFVELALRQAIAKGARNVNTMRRLVDLGVEHVELDNTLQLENLIQLGRTFRNFDPGDLQTHTLPVDEAPPGGPAYLYLREAEAEVTLQLFRGGTGGIVPPVPVEDVTVQVRNATGTANQARDVAQALGGLGFSSLIGVDGAPGFPTVIQYGPGKEAHARVVASWLGGSFVYAVEELPEGVDVVLITGQGWAGIRPEALPYDQVPEAVPPTIPETTTTTAAPGATTEPGASTTSVPEDPPGAVDDPDEDAFYRATAPPPGASCQRTS